MYDPNKHHRRSIRLPGYDYTLVGAYYVTICAYQRAHLFGEVLAGVMQPNSCGEIVVATWRWLASQYPWVELGPFVLMPNHLHGIIVLNADASNPMGTQGETTNAPRLKPLGRLLGAFKTVSTKQANAAKDSTGATLWQRNYYEHIIRNDREWTHICDYITMNPAVWADDPENASCRGRS